MLTMHADTVTLAYMNAQETLFEQVVRDYQGSLNRIVATYELIPALQQELHQEILLAIWKSLARFRGDSSLHTFIFRIAHNQAINHVSRYSRRPGHQAIDTSIPDDNTSPELAAMDRQEIQLVIKAMHQLPVLQRQLLALSLEGLSYKELAEVTGLSESNVGVRLNRAKKALKDYMEQYHG
jgi:RNA polymerase sigma-70 factor (ECF subfamily)